MQGLACRILPCGPAAQALDLESQAGRGAMQSMQPCDCHCTEPMLAHALSRLPYNPFTPRPSLGAACPALPALPTHINKTKGREQERRGLGRIPARSAIKINVSQSPIKLGMKELVGGYQILQSASQISEKKKPNQTFFFYKFFILLKF